MNILLKRLLIVAVAFMVMIASAGVLISWLYEDEVKALVLNEVNQNLKTDIKVERISLSLFKKFPYASLRFQNLMALDAIETTAPKDTLLYAQDFYLEFNVLDIFTRDYTIRNIDVEHAVLRLKVDENGRDNFHFWTERSDTASSRLGFKLQHVGLKDVDFSYRNAQNEFHLDTQIDVLVLSGNFHDKRFDMEVESQLLIQKLSLREDSYIKSRRVNLVFDLSIDMDIMQFKVKDGEVRFEELGFLVNGSYQIKADNQDLNLIFAGEDIQIADLLVFIPEKYKARLENYAPDGNATVNLTLIGDPSSKEDQMNIELDFDINDAQFKHKKSGVDLRHLKVKGTYRNRGNNPDILEFENVSFFLKEGSIQGKGSIVNFQRPLVKFDIEGKAQLAVIQQFLDISELEYITGQVELSSHFTGLISDPNNLTITDLQKSEITGKLTFTNTAFKIKDKDHRYHDFNGEFHFNGNDAAFKGLEGMIQSSDFKMDGLFKNFIPFLLLDKQMLKINASLQSKYIDLAEILISSKENETDSAFNFTLPEFIEIQANAKIEELNFRTFSATNIVGFVKINREGIFAQPLNFRTSEGDFSARLHIVDSDKRGIFSVDAQAECVGVNISRLFIEFDNFGQKFVTNEHLRGTANASVVFKAEMDRKLDIDEKSIYSLLDINIMQGKLIGLEALQEVVAYVRKNKLLAPLIKVDELKKKLEYIEFSSLQNQIEIKNEKIYIPEMLLESSAININAKGWHAFNGEVDYRIHFRLAEVLTNNKHSEFGEIKDDGSGGSFFLRLQGKIGDLDISYDKQTAKEKRKEYFNQEKETFKDLLKEEFNIFGKKDKNKTSIPETGNTKFELDFTGGDEVDPVIEPDKQQSTSTKETNVQQNSPKKSPKAEKDIWKELEEDDDF